MKPEPGSLRKIRISETYKPQTDEERKSATCRTREATSSQTPQTKNDFTSIESKVCGSLWEGMSLQGHLALPAGACGLHPAGIQLWGPGPCCTACQARQSPWPPKMGWQQCLYTLQSTTLHSHAQQSSSFLTQQSCRLWQSQFQGPFNSIGAVEGPSAGDLWGLCGAFGVRDSSSSSFSLQWGAGSCPQSLFPQDVGPALFQD